MQAEQRYRREISPNDGDHIKKIVDDFATNGDDGEFVEEDEPLALPSPEPFESKNKVNIFESIEVGGKTI